MTLSHRGDLDWVAGYLVATQFNFIHVGLKVEFNNKTLSTKLADPSVID